MTEWFGNMQIHVNAKNFAICVGALFFLYLVYVLWGRGDSGFPEIWLELPELINYCVMAVEAGGVAVRQIHGEKQLLAQSKGKTLEGATEFVTRADLISNHLIADTLRRFPGLQVVSEEKEDVPDGDVEPYRRSNQELWLSYKDMLKGIPKERVPLSELTIWVDPLDATQEFTEDLVEYVTIMICIALRGRPKFGVIYRPFANETIWGLVGQGVFSSMTGGSESAVSDGEPAKRIVVSRSHAGAVKELAGKAFGSAFRVEPAGGAGYKTLRVLNGTAAMYLHKTAIKKWDVCAGDAIIRAAGGQMLTLQGTQLTYFTKDNVKNENGLLVSLNKPFAYLAKLHDYVPNN